MKTLVGLAAAFAVVFAAVGGARAADGRIAVVAAENFYGDVAHQIGGDHVAVTSIMSNPDQDPHLFETAPSVVRQVAGAKVVIYNGVDYDPWMAKLLEATPNQARSVIVVGELVHKVAGDNPHLWYDPPTMPTVAKALAAAFSVADPAHKAGYAANLRTFIASLEPLHRKIATLRSKYAGVAVTASEPVFGYMAGALGLKMRNEHFQLAVMNNTEPSPSDVAAFERDLKQHKVRILFYNKQASDNVVTHLVNLARAAHIAVVGVTETCPPGVSYQNWMMSEVDAAAKALAGPSS
jgi:zinc/manganese transport system substrate-binding protein